MPECYTHVCLGAGALMCSGYAVASHSAFVAGACGPDPFYMYRVWRRKHEPNLPLLAAAMHRERTGAFLRALVDFAATPIQQSFVLGYLTHYAADCTLSPYMAAMSGEGQPYAGKNGVGQLGASLDSELYYRDYKTRTVPLRAGSPVLITDELGQVSTLLREAIWEVYRVNLPLLAIADAYHHNLAARWLMISKTRATKPLLSLVDALNATCYGGPLAHRMQPAKKLKSLPQLWVNPHSGQQMNQTLDEVLLLARQTGAICITAAMRYWLGELSVQKLADIFGNNNYTTGLSHGPDPDSTVPENEEESTPHTGEQTA